MSKEIVTKNAVTVPVTVPSFAVLASKDSPAILQSMFDAGAVLYQIAMQRRPTASLTFTIQED